MRSAASIPLPWQRTSCSAGSSAASRRSASVTSHQAGRLAAEPRYGIGRTPSKPAKIMRSFQRSRRNTGMSRMATNHSMPQWNAARVSVW